jgi:hypothetical protein
MLFLRANNLLCEEYKGYNPVKKEFEHLRVCENGANFIFQKTVNTSCCIHGREAKPHNSGAHLRLSSRLN